MSDIEARRTELREITKQLIAAYGTKDFDAFAQHVDPDAVFDWPFLPLKEFPSEVQGRDRFIEISKAGMANCDGYFHKIDEFYDLADSDSLIVEYHSDTVLPESGKRYENKYLGILRFSGNQVVWWREYVNPLPIIEAYGLDFSNEATA